MQLTLKISDIILSISMLGTFIYLVSRLNFPIVDDKEPVYVFFLFIFSGYLSLYLYLIWKFYKTNNKGYRISAFIMASLNLVMVYFIIKANN